MIFRPTNTTSQNAGTWHCVIFEENGIFWILISLTNGGIRSQKVHVVFVA